MIRITGYGIIAEKPRVGKLGQIFHAPCRKNYTLDRIMDDTFYDGHDELYQHAKFDLNRCNESPLRGEKPDFWPVSKNNRPTGSLRLHGILPVKA